MKFLGDVLKFLVQIFPMVVELLDKAEERKKEKRKDNPKVEHAVTIEE